MKKMHFIALSLLLSLSLLFAILPVKASYADAGQFYKKVSLPATAEDINYTGAWSTSGTSKSSAEQNASAQLTFHGYGIEVTGGKGAGNGLIKIEIDHMAPVTVDTYSPVTKTACVLYSTELEPGPHTVTITVLSGGKSFVLDSFNVMNLLQPLQTTYNYDNPAISGWYPDPNPAHGRHTGFPNDLMSFTFFGTAIQANFMAQSSIWADISIDGGPAAEVNTSQTKRFEKTGLDSDFHTITVITKDKGGYANFHSFVVESWPTVEKSFGHDHESITGNWAVSEAPAVGLPALVPSTAPAAATIRFTGSAISLYGGCDPNAGSVKVTIDGSFVDTFTPVAGPSWYIRQLFKRYSGLEESEHTMTIEYESGYWIWLYGYTTLGIDHSALTPADPQAEYPALSGLSFSAGSLYSAGSNPEPALFESDITEYSLRVPYDVTSVTVTADTPAGGFAVGIDGTPGASKAVDFPQAQSEKTVSVTVTDGATDKTYAITFLRPASRENLKKLLLKQEELPAAGDVWKYDATGEGDIDILDLLTLIKNGL